MEATPVTDNPTTANRHLKNARKAELALHDSTGRRGSALQTVYSYLSIVPPTSVEAERAFSACSRNVHHKVALAAW